MSGEIVTCDAYTDKRHHLAPGAVYAYTRCETFSYTCPNSQPDMDNRRGGNIPRNSKTSKNGPRGNSFKLLSESNDDESITVETTSARGRPLKRTQVSSSRYSQQAPCPGL